MRPLTEEETKIFFEKLAKYIGSNIKLLLDRPDGQYVFRLQKERVYYVSDDIMRRATNFPRESLVGLGVCFGKFTKTKKFRITITALDYIAQYAQYKVWVKPSAEQSFLCSCLTVPKIQFQSHKCHQHVFFGFFQMDITW
eukprot:c7401_g1_i2.p1 GENE.c7401_g1_i2~~c7401_g1_i2.p1  ORF type:complete len:140 (-),score=21.87 c7401_g1_i2:6-425(-)